MQGQFIRTTSRIRRLSDRSLFTSAVRTLTLICALAVPAKGDIGLPMLFVTWPEMLVALIPIVFIEAWVLRASLGLPTSQTLRLSLLSNLASTVIGIPVAWVVLVLLEIPAGTALGLDTPWRRIYAVTVQAPWLIPYPDDVY
jgi:hypothetical protein